MKRVVASVLVFFSLSLSGFAQDGKLHKIKERIKEKQEQPSEQTTTVGTTNTVKKREKPFRSLVGAIAWNLTYGVLVESVFERESSMHNAAISAYPFQSKTCGNYVYSYNDSIPTVFSRLDLTDHFLYESSKLYGNNLDVKWRFAKRFDLDIAYLHLIEQTDSGADALALFSAMANYHRIRTQRLDLWFGLGTTYVASNVNSFGFSYGVGGEWFIKRPISLYTYYKGSTINSKSLHSVQLFLKYYQHNYSFSAGYTYFDFAGEPIHLLGLGVGVYL